MKREHTMTNYNGVYDTPSDYVLCELRDMSENEPGKITAKTIIGLKNLIIGEPLAHRGRTPEIIYILQGAARHPAHRSIALRCIGELGKIGATSRKSMDDSPTDRAQTFHGRHMRSARKQMESHNHVHDILDGHYDLVGQDEAFGQRE